MNDTPDNISFTLLETLSRLKQQNGQLAADLGTQSKSDINGNGDRMDLTTYRLDQAEKRAEAADVRMARVEDKLTEIQVTLAGLATKDSIRNWGFGLTAIILATGVGVGAMMLQSSNNELAAFQSGLGAIQAVSAAHDLTPASPLSKN
jgi:hypothetical protein